MHLVLKVILVVVAVVLALMWWYSRIDAGCEGACRRSRTLAINAVIAALAAAESVLGVVQPLLPVNFYAVIAAALPVINAVMRKITEQRMTLGGSP